MSHLKKIDFELYYTSFFKNLALHCKHVFDYKGNESRKAFWLFILAKHLILLIPGSYLLVRFTAAIIKADDYFNSRALMDSVESVSFIDLLPTFFYLVFFIYLLLALFFFLVTLSAEARRIADAGYSRAWLFLYLVPITGTSLVLFIFEVFETKDHYNKYVIKYNEEGIKEQAEIFNQLNKEESQESQAATVNTEDEEVVSEAQVESTTETNK